MVQPRREHAVAAQLAPVLVRMDVVRIVGPRAVVLEVAERPAVGEAAGGRAVLAVRQAGRPREQAVDVLAPSSAAAGRVMSTVVAVGAMTIRAGSISTM